MRGRVAIVAIVLGLLGSTVTLPLHAALQRQAREIAALGGEPRAWSIAPALGLNAVLVSLLVFGVLYFVVVLPLSRAERAVARLAEDLDVGGFSGPLTNRLERALRTMSTALKDERERNARQLADLKASNARLARLQAELVAADRMATVGKLAAGVAHEVGNPLAGILGYVSVLRMRTTDAEKLEMLERVEKEVQRIDEIVRSLLELGRPSRGAAQPVDVRTAIDSAVRLVSAGREFAQVKVVVDAPASLWLRAETGPLSQVLINLLLNAAQAMEQGGVVTVRALEQGGRGLICVEDQGPGLSPAVRERLFEPFFTTRPPGQGTGLGLAISRHLLAQFEGDLSVANREPGGAIFTISLPLP
jgi:C4-dicarboxylate-specific signal transduction histidine kinase